MVAFEVHIKKTEVEQRSQSCPDGMLQLNVLDRVKGWLNDWDIVTSETLSGLICRAPATQFTDAFQVSLCERGQEYRLVGDPVWPDDLAPFIENMVLSRPPTLS